MSSKFHNNYHQKFIFIIMTDPDKCLSLSFGLGPPGYNIIALAGFLALLQLLR